MSYNTAGAYYPSPGQSPKKSHRVRNTFIGLGALTLGLFGGCGIIVAALPDETPALEYTDPAPKPLGTATPTAKPAVKPPAIVDGVWLVGEEVKPGTYRSSGKDTCYWARLSTTDGDALEGIIANGIGPNQTVTIKASDVAFQSQLCGGWVRVR